MSVRALRTEIAELFGSSVLISEPTGLPRVITGIWLSLNELRFSEKYTREHLRAFNLFYNHCDIKFGNTLHIDKSIVSGDIETILSSLRSFIAERQNHASITGYDQSRSLSLVTQIIQDVLSEIRYRNKQPGFDGAKVTRSLATLDGLYRFLKPLPDTKNIKIRSLPDSVLNHFFKTLRPDNTENPFRNTNIKHRNFLIFALLYQMGLRRGELLLLSADCMKMAYDEIAKRNVYWLDINDPEHYDVRLDKPRLKNVYSQRQVPLPEGLYAQLLKYVINFRGRCSHGFLFSSQYNRPLSMRSLNDITLKISKTLSLEAKSDLRLRCGVSRVTPHNFRHSAAVDRIRSYRHSGIEMDHAEAMLRAFFGWSPTSKMPLLYARAFYEEQLNTTWLSEFDQRIVDLFGYDR